MNDTIRRVGTRCHVAVREEYRELNIKSPSTRERRTVPECLISFGAILLARESDCASVLPCIPGRADGKFIPTCCELPNVLNTAYFSQQYFYPECQPRSVCTDGEKEYRKESIGACETPNREVNVTCNRSTILR